jgi:transketolase N-terminal domain/subunit
VAYLRHALGQDDTGSPELPDMTTAQWQSLMLQSQQRLVDNLTAFTEREKLQRWIQIAATLSIPLAAAIWKALGVGRKKIV